MPGALLVLAGCASKGAYRREGSEKMANLDIGLKYDDGKSPLFGETSTRIRLQMSGGAMGAFAVSGLQAHLPLLAMPTVMLACVLLSASVFTLGLRTARRAPIQA